MPDFDDKVYIDVDEVLKETDRAILCRLVDRSEVWIPKSQIDDESEVNHETDSGTLVISQWLADEKGLD